MASVVVEDRSQLVLGSAPKMIVKTPLVLNNDLQHLISNSKVLVVGAGGIGCELLKNLVLSGFEDIEVIDMDTIEVSNLNRQFLFQKKHVGQPKAKVACESVRQFNPKAKLVPHHASVLSSEFGVGYIEKFSVVLNALDNRTARSHVNRLCLAAGVPLVESGSSGYIGQVELISKNRTQCYECDPKPPSKTYPGCTIRNTPSELIHCIVWAKHLFNQLFGLRDPREEDEDVSPDPTDAAAGGDSDNSVPKMSTREWAERVGYESQALFKKLFEDDIHYLLTMTHLWETRRSPVPLDWNKAKSLTEEYPGNQITEPRIPSQKVWTISECADIFATSSKVLKESMEKSPDGYLTWDKDVKPAMDFVAAAANIRAHIFGIELKSRFEIKSMAGNIVPAIATSNAIIAGLVVLNAMNILRGELDQCQSVYLRDAPNGRGAIIVRERNLPLPKPYCTVCSEKPQVVIATDLSKLKCKEFESGVLKHTLNMIAPDVQLDSTGDIFISSEEGETEHNNDKTLEDIGIRDGTILQADDFLQNYKITIIVKQRELGRDDPPFIVTSDISTLKPKEEKKEENTKTSENGKDGYDNMNSKSSKSTSFIDDDCLIVYDDEPIMILNDEDEEPRKRKQEEIPVPVKKRKTDQGPSSSESDVII